MSDFIDFERVYYPKVDRPAVVIAFAKASDPQEMAIEFRDVRAESSVLREWTSRLDQCGQLKVGWNGYDAAAPSAEAIAWAKSFLSSIMGDANTPSRIAPSTVGGIGITHKNRARRVYVEFFNDGDILALFSDNETEPISKRVKPGYGAFRELNSDIRNYLNG